MAQAVQSKGRDMAYTVGTKVVARAYGLVKICGITSMDVGGGTVQFYELIIVSTGIKLLVPVTSARDNFREVMSPQMAQDILRSMAQPMAVTSRLWNRRLKIFTERMNSGDLEDWVAVFRGLWAMKSRYQRLSITEQMLFDKVTHWLRDEISEAQGWSAQETEAQMIRALAMTGALPQRDQAGAVSVVATSTSMRGALTRAITNS